MEILSTIWQIVWIALLITTAVGSLLLLTALIHPLRFDVKLRGSLKGQRAEVWFVYLFRLFRIGIIATPHTQDVVISFMGWKKRLERMGRQKSPGRPSEPPPIPPSSDSSTPAAPADEPERPEPTVGEVHLTTKQDSPQSDSSSEPPAQPQVAEKPAESVAAEMPEPAKAETPRAAPEIVTSEEKKAPPTEDEPQTVEPVATATQSSQDIDSRPLKPLHEVEAEHQTAKETATASEQPDKSQSKKGDSLRQMLRKFKRDASRRFRQIKGYLRLFRRKWRLLSPIGKRFWRRGKKAFGLPRIDLLLRYALHEPYLTGMSHATLAVASGMAGQWGVNFMPVPHFGAPMVYSRACITAIIKPWRLLFATGALLFEKQLYVELWQLFKWYRAKKQH